MADERFLVVRLSSLGDIVHNLPAVSSLRDAFPDARIDWLVDRKWTALLDGNPDLNEVIELDRGSWNALRVSVERLRARRYTCAIDFQGLYKSALLSFLSGARRRVGFGRPMAREPGAAFFYTERVLPTSCHKVDHNLALAETAGARPTAYRFPLCVSRSASADVARQIARNGVGEFFVVSPGGGWRWKCWPPERYGELCRELEQRLGWRSVVNCGPEETELGQAVCRAAQSVKPVLLATDVPQLMALLSRARLVIGGDTGPLHLAVALGTPVVGLYGPTDPARNGPFSTEDVVVRNARPGETTYKRQDAYSPAMLSILPEQVIQAVEKRLGARR